MAPVVSPVRGFLASVDTQPVILVRFQFNPTAVTDKRTATWATLAAPGALLPDRQYTAGGERTLSFTASVDARWPGVAVDEDGGIGPELTKYRAFVHPRIVSWPDAAHRATGFTGLYTGRDAGVHGPADRAVRFRRPGRGLRRHRDHDHRDPVLAVARAAARRRRRFARRAQPLLRRAHGTDDMSGPTGRFERAPVTEVTAPDGTRRRVVALRLSADTPAGSDTHRVVAGEQIDAVARRALGAESLWWAVLDVNPTRYPLELAPGEMLRLPDPGTTTRADRTRTF